MEKKIQLRVSKFPNRPGVYMFQNGEGKVLYVGKALQLKARVLSYFNKDTDAKAQKMVAAATNVTYIETGSEFEALLLEANLIKKYRPRYNVIFRDDKSYLYIFISVDEEFPKIFTTRKPKGELNDQTKELYEGMKGIYFGPFPSSGRVRRILTSLRKLLPFCQQRKLGRPCFYSHIGLCVPCPSQIVKAPFTQRDQFKKEYRKHIFAIKKILEGSIESVVHDLENEMIICTKNESYERAAQIRDQITGLEMLLHNREVTGFLENPNFYFDRQSKALDELKRILGKYYPGLYKLTRIECFDISTYQGNFSSGSQIVFVAGVPEKKYYRKYRIKRIGKPNDTEMLKETLTRRFSHIEWAFPDLVIVDGGKGQVSIAQDLFRAQRINIPVIGLTKQFEKIVVRGNGGFKEITLRRKSPSLRLVQQMRDEAHRFARSYTRLLARFDFGS